MKRILVTGSRGWTDARSIELALMGVASAFEGERCVIVHGACPTGADAIADSLAAKLGMPVEAHPADWSRGRGAGPARNEAMVKLGADVCLAFISDCTSPRCFTFGRHPSHGASGCADLAEKAGIATTRIYEEKP